MATKYATAELHGNIVDHEKRIGALEKNDVKQDERIGELRKDTEKNCGDLEKFSSWRSDVDKVIAVVATYNQDVKDVKKLQWGIIATILVTIILTLLKK